MIRLFTAIVFLSLSLFAEIPILKTGQEISYRAGDDGAYQIGAEKLYIKRNDYVIDLSTNLMWANLSYSSIMGNNYNIAVNHCNDLVVDGVDGDWRLPTAKEFYSLVDYSQEQMLYYINSLGLMSHRHDNDWHAYSIFTSTSIIIDNVDSYLAVPTYGYEARFKAKSETEDLNNYYPYLAVCVRNYQ